jgi:two-component system nitrogen regulation sensor histidine kinase GlnL
VDDHSKNIAPAIRDRFFFPLVSGGEGGSGLGLTIAQTFGARLGGNFECECVPGRTVFTFGLPLVCARVPVPS